MDHCQEDTPRPLLKLCLRKHQKVGWEWKVMGSGSKLTTDPQSRQQETISLMSDSSEPVCRLLHVHFTN